MRCFFQGCCLLFLQMSFLKLCLAVVLFASVPVNAKQPRKPAAKAEFQREHPCPVTNKRRGRCPGYQIDHVTPLKCGGADHYSNMQWLTIQEHKKKTAREARWCRRK